MRTEKQNQSKFMRIIGSPIRALGKARDLYVRSITNCGQNISYGNPMDDASKFSSFSRSQSAASSRSNNQGNDDFAELVRAASARTMGNRIDVDLVLKQQENNNGLKLNNNNKGLPKSSSVGMAKIDEEKPFEYSSIQGGGAFATARSKSYVGGNNRNPYSF